MNAPAPHFRLGTRPALDGVRAIAVTSVFVFHANRIFLPESSAYYLPNGFLGVDIFFVLSGFLITNLLLEEHDLTGRISFGKFYARRALRLLPALFLFLAVTAINAAARLPATEAKEVFQSVGYAIFYSTNWVCALDIAHVSNAIHHTWSLAIEEQFYLWWPVALSVLLKLQIPRSWMTGVLVLAIGAICLHRVGLVAGGAHIPRIYEGSDTRADSLLVGCLAAMFSTCQMIPSRRLAKVIIGILCFASAIAVEMFLTAHIPAWLLTGYGFSLFAIAVATCLYLLVHCPQRLVTLSLESRPMVWIGKLSYSIYLWHIFAISLVSSAPWPLRAKIIASIAITLGIASFSFYAVERPFLQMKRRFEVSHPIQGSIDDLHNDAVITNAPNAKLGQVNL